MFRKPALLPFSRRPSSVAVQFHYVLDTLVINKYKDCYYEFSPGTIYQAVKIILYFFLHLCKVFTFDLHN